MIGLMKQSGHITYGLKEYVVDSEDDIDLLPLDCPMGSSAFVIQTGDMYMMNGNHEWVKI